MKRFLGWGCSSIVKHLPGIYKALGLISKTRRERGREREGGRERRRERERLIYL
jgi:hypothetical protein